MVITVLITGPFGTIYERAQVVDFTFPVMVDYYTVIVPIKLDKDKYPMIRPFEWRVWLGIFILSPMFLLALAASDWFFTGSVQWANIFGFVFRNIFSEPPAWVPHNGIYSKIFALTWMIAFFVLARGYSGKNFIVMT
jgi:hypothetical protein